MMIYEPYEPKEPPPKIRRRVTPGEAWLRGYAAAVKGKPPTLPGRRVILAAYLRGYDAGTLARQEQTGETLEKLYPRPVCC